MTATITRVLDGFDTWGLHGVSIRKFTGDTSYPSGGYSLAGTNFGFGNKPLEGVVVLGALTALGATLFPMYDALNKKLVINAGGSSEYNYVPGGGDIKGSANTDVPIASGSLPTNGDLISNLANAANTTTMTIAVSPDVARNVGVAYKNTNAGASTGNAVTNVITGTFRGAAQTESISFSAAELTSTVQNEVAFKYGVKPFDTITSITAPVAQPANWQKGAGIGSKLGLPVPTLNNAEADIIKITKDGANLAPTGLFSTNQTVNLGVMSDGADVAILYRASGAVAPGTSLAGCTWILMGICRGT